ncbi:MAG: DUF2161 family putative PD-(D/E)XK-type phosphodiesterase [Defluviitaleaceae bacterium]|nr:DUF2161 family putative PD-(D/E)XK-type phosphodiesterase [Defluviitaleaceae bacterium]
MKKTKKSTPFAEADMYKPVKDFFTGMGYTVNGEVLGIDICLQKDGVLTIIEMKKSLNMTLLIQAVDRQSVTGQVFIAVPRPLRPRHKDTKTVETILKKLGLGLIYVNMSSRPKSIEIIMFPSVDLKARGTKRKEQVDKELAGRSVDVNTGGQTRKPIATAYRERAVRIAALLETHGALSVKNLRHDHGCDEKTNYILKNNYYGWFEHVTGERSNAAYGLSADGISMLLDEAAGGDFMELIQAYRSDDDM